ncbi:YdbL family protein [Shewanella sp. GXUN23E]|uniref:YdbL family protein n=1 Tax=Shewanella sp. GXUN23E TaxID=3422498 RepID=UPI003D7C47C2
MKTIFAAFAALLISVSAYAMTLQEAKTQGYLGEQLNGYLGQVHPNPAAAAVMLEVNAKRKAEYEKIAKQNGVSLTFVEQQVGSKAIAAASAGEYIQSEQGGWVTKP